MFDEADSVVVLDSLLPVAAFTVDPGVAAETQRGQAMVVVQTAALAAGNVIAVLHAKNGVDRSILAMEDPEVFLVVATADFPAYTVKVAAIVVPAGNAVKAVNAGFDPNATMTFSATAVPTVALVTETGLQLLAAAQTKRNLAPTIRDGPAKDYGKGPHATLQDANAVLAGKRVSVVTPGVGGKNRLDGYEVVSQDGKVLACTSKGEGQKRLLALDATVRLMDSDRFLLVIKDLQYEDKYFRGRFAHYAKDTAALPKTHPMKSAGGWSRLGKMQLLQPAKSVTLQAFVLGRLDAYDYSETAWEDLAETDVPFVPWARESSRPGKWQLRVYVKALEGFLVLIFSPVFGGTFDALLAQLDSDDYPFRNFYDLLAAVLVWAMIAQVFHDVKNELTSGGLPLSSPTDVRAALVAATQQLVEDMLAFRGDWSHMPHHDFFMHEGRHSMIAFRTTKRKAEPGADNPAPGKHKKPKGEGLADLNTPSGELNTGAGAPAGGAPKGPKKQKKPKKEKTPKAGTPAPAPNPKAPKAGTWCLFSIAELCGATASGAPIKCTRGATCFGKHPTTLQDLTAAEAHAALAAATSIGTAKRAILTDAFTASDAKKEFK